MLGELLEDEDVYGESLPELGAHHHYHYAAAVGASSFWPPRVRMHSLETPVSIAEQHRLSSSMSEVPGADYPATSISPGSAASTSLAMMTAAALRRRGGGRGSAGPMMIGESRMLAAAVGAAGDASLHELNAHRAADSLESTRSLTYLEWVHERQTRRMLTRSEWFLAGSGTIAPRADGKSTSVTAKLGGSSKSVDFSPAEGAASAAAPAAIVVTSRFSSPMHLKLPKHDEDLLTSSGDEDMSSVFLPSTSSSMKFSPRPVSSVSSSGVGGSGSACAVPTTVSASITGRRDASASSSKMSVDEDERLSSVSVSSSVSRKDDDASMSGGGQLLMLPRSSGYGNGIGSSNQLSPIAVSPELPHGTATASTSEVAEEEKTPPAVEAASERTASLSASETVTPDAPALPASRRRKFFASGSGGKDPEATTVSVFQHPDSSATSAAAQVVAQTLCGTRLSSSSSSGSSVATAVHIVAAGAVSASAGDASLVQPLQRRVSSSGVIRRRSWRTHYTRPNRSLECEGEKKVEVDQSSKSTPIYYSSPAGSGDDGNRRGSNDTAEEEEKEKCSCIRMALIRRKSSGNGGGTSGGGKSKVPVQMRRSTQI